MFFKNYNHRHKNIVPLPNKSILPTPRDLPPAYKILDPRDRLVVSHGPPSACPGRTIVTDATRAAIPQCHVSMQYRSPRTVYRACTTTTGTWNACYNAPARRSYGNQVPANYCTRCTSFLSPGEFPDAPPSRRCRHSMNLCVFCLHDEVQDMTRRYGWQSGRIKCPQCGERLETDEVIRVGLLWTKMRL